MSTKVQSWGNSLGVRIPFKVAQKYNIVNGTEVEIVQDDEGVLIKPVKQKPTLEDLLAKCEGENPHPEYFSVPMGKELL